MTLRELLKNKTLPVYIIDNSPDAMPLLVKCVADYYAFVVNETSLEERLLSLTNINYDIYSKPRPKKKMYAYLVRYPIKEQYAMRYFDSEVLTKEYFGDHVKVIRAPTLDCEVDCD
jgi:hypothetical protein